MSGVSILCISSWDLELTQPFEILPQISLVLQISYVTIKHDILHKKQYLNGNFIYVLMALSALEKITEKIIRSVYLFLGQNQFTT